MARACVALVAVVLLVAPVLGQTPQPFPRPTTPQPNPPSQPAAPVPPPTTVQAPAPVQSAPAAPADPNAPDPATIYFPLYPTAQFIASYDAGRGQRYYVYGTSAPYLDLVTFYRTQLRERGDQVFLEPPTHMFSVGRFREETMAFPPGVTIKDWTWGGSKGNPNPNGPPERFPAIIMIVPPPPAAPAARE